MGYTHHWHHNRTFSVEDWGKITAAIREIISNSDVDIAGGDGTGDPIINDDIISFNGRKGEDGLGDSHETFYMPRVAGESYNFCKTERKPYDVVVVATLLAIYALTDGQYLEIWSEGDIWGDGNETAEFEDMWDEFTTAHKLLHSISAAAA